MIGESPEERAARLGWLVVGLMVVGVAVAIGFVASILVSVLAG